MKNSKKIAVIGSGLGGLSAAIRLAIRGFEVKVFEKSGKPGGKAGTIEFYGFRFDTGPTLLTMPFVLEELFTDAGESIEDYIELKKLNVNCKYFYPDGTVLNAFSDTGQFAEEVELKLGEKASNVKKYLDYCHKIYELTGSLFLQKSLHEISTYTNKTALNTLFNINKIDTGRTMHEANSTFFKNKKLVQLFDRYATYNGSSPFLAPATLNVIQHVEYNLGGFIPANGIYDIPDGLYKLAVKLGVQFNFHSSVNEIMEENRKITGLAYKVNTGEEIEEHFDIIVSNADVNITYGKLLGDTKTKQAKRYLDLPPSSSALVFYWGIEKQNPDLEIHNILFSDDYSSEFEDLFNRGICPEDPTVYIYISSKYNKHDAPANCENWYVMINAPSENGQDWSEEIANARNKIINKIKNNLGVDVGESIVSEKILSPLDIEKKTGSFKGSLYGISSNSKTAAFMRQRNRSSDYKGLYFCGGSAHPGGGIPLVLLSGKITSELINKYE